EGEDPGPQSQGRGEEKGDTPAPVHECVLGHGRGEQGGNPVASGETCGGACRVPTPVPAAPAIWRRLHEKRHRAGNLAAGGEALYEPQKQQRDWRQDTDRRPGRQEGHCGGRQRHHHDHATEGWAPPGVIRAAAHYRGADQPGDEREREDGESGRECHTAAGGKERTSKDRRQSTVDSEVVPFHGVAQASADECAPRAPGLRRYRFDPAHTVLSLKACTVGRLHEARITRAGEDRPEPHGKNGARRREEMSTGSLYRRSNGRAFRGG